MARHALTDHFAAFFARLNPSPSFVRTASSEHRTVTGLIEGTRGAAAELEPRCFLQGSYRQDTAIYTINDVDIVVLCRLWQGGEGGGGGRSWDRDAWYARPIRTPCGERDIFLSSEWQRESWRAFHRAAITWAKCAGHAQACPDRSPAIEFWRLLLGEEFFPEQVSR